MFDFITESFDLEKTNEYILSIQVSLDGFSFSVFSKEENKIIAFKCKPLKISNDNLILLHFNEWVENEELLQKRYLKTILVYYTPEFLLIPENLFNSDLVQEANTHLISANDQKETEIDFVSGLETGAKIIFNLPLDLKKLIFRSLASTELIHPVQLMLGKVTEGSKKNRIVLLYNKKSCILLVKRDNQVLLANGFNASHVNDLVYYVLNAIMQLNLNPKETDFYLSDSLTRNEELEQLLKPYFPEISYLSSATSAENAEMVPCSIHRYFSIN